MDWRRAYISMVRDVSEKNKSHVLEHNRFGEGPLDKILVGADLSDKQFINVDLDLSNGNLSFVKLGKNAFTGANLKEINLDKAKISGDLRISFSDLSGAKLTNIDFSHKNIDFFQTNLSKADFTNSSIKSRRFAEIRHYFRYCDFSDAFLTRFNISGAVFSNSFYKDGDGNKKPITLEYLTKRGAIWDTNSQPHIVNVQ